MALGGALLPPFHQPTAAAISEAYHPPSMKGLRGSHPGSNATAHTIAFRQKPTWSAPKLAAETYDLVVVGAGLSGLAAARFYQQQHGADKRILILDNHDDFGGHAKRNEHIIDGQQLISYGGSQTLVEPLHASPILHALFEDIGIDLSLFDAGFDRGFFERHNLSAVTYFNAEHFGQDQVVRHPFCNYYNLSLIHI